MGRGRQRRRQSLVLNKLTLQEWDELITDMGPAVFRGQYGAPLGRRRRKNNNHVGPCPLEHTRIARSHLQSCCVVSGAKKHWVWVVVAMMVLTVKVASGASAVCAEC